ncbi:uncharacterized protein BDR25DRAFT_394221 [Lindgomyces ingoldianus]|uniref:Uncharacterized protein n=1 Tax=Lindgomyces ingoldianus TaxID=673940 RepID=A0ACB6QSC2_9PLEO|nr:uncharacterized protein BDR25DRAFT_394221 [Lindgomyces ingoldianus]KAF2469908.1 hypothetical protein BDR25DRAFT_394221 [Lindgomyces ingoldianus]
MHSSNTGIQMATRKRNEWLEAEESDDDERGYDSEEESRSHILRSSKRRKTAHQSAEEDEDGQEEQAQSDEGIENSGNTLKCLKDQEVPTSTTSNPNASKTTPKPAKPVKPKKDRSGVIYLSRVPPFMKPSVLRSLLEPYGAINRIFLQQESSTLRTSRLKSGGNRRKLYLDGWVEFLSKKDAKFVSESLNAQIIGGKKRGRWHDEVWNIKYLHKLKWHHLVERLQNENAERTARMRAEIAQNTKENKMFLENLERSKMLQGMESKQKSKKAFENAGEDGTGEGKVIQSREVDKVPRRTFKQNEVKLKGEKEVENADENHIMQPINPSS